MEESLFPSLSAPKATTLKAAAAWWWLQWRKKVTERAAMRSLAILREGESGVEGVGNGGVEKAARAWGVEVVKLGLKRG